MNLQPSYRVPLSVHIVLTNRCNNRCSYCHVHKLPQDDTWTTSGLKEALKSMKKCGTRRIQFTGGEPMLRSDIGELIDYAKQLGFFVGLSSNGHQMAERIDEIKNLDVMFLSYDGPEDVHSRLRSQKSFDAIEPAILALKNHNIQVMTTTVLTTVNAESLSEIIDFARRHKIIANFNPLEFFHTSPSYLHPLFDEIKELALCGEGRKNVLRELIALKKSGAPIGSSFPYLRNALNWPYDDRITDPSPSKIFKCWAGRAYAHLEADGRLYACGWDVGRKEGEDVLKKGFKNAWKDITSAAECQSCSNACNVESNLIFSLNPSSLLNAYKGLK